MLNGFSRSIGASSDWEFHGRFPSAANPERENLLSPRKKNTPIQSQTGHHPRQFATVGTPEMSTLKISHDLVGFSLHFIGASHRLRSNLGHLPLPPSPSDVFGLDPELLAFVPTPVIAVLLLFPVFLQSRSLIDRFTLSTLLITLADP